MNLENFTPLSATLGGILIGLATSLLLLFNGRICGISGILGPLLTPKTTKIAWRIAFLFGLISGGLIVTSLYPQVMQFELNISSSKIIIAGLLVGFGTRLGCGCTSGHGVCGIARVSKRSIVATIVFMMLAMITLFVENYWKDC